MLRFMKTTFGHSNVCCIAFSASSVFQLTMTKMKTVSPQASASYISLLFFSWLDPLVWAGWKRPLRQQDLPAVSPEVSVTWPSS